MITTSKKFRDKVIEALVLAGPIIAGQVGQILMSFFDTVQIGGLGADYIAGSGFANSTYWTFNLFGVGMLFAVGTLVSEVRGEKQEWKIIPVYRSGIKVALVLSVLFSLLMWWVIANIEIFGQPERINILAVRFLRIVNYSTVFVFLFACSKQLLDGMGRTKVGMVVTIGGLLLNIFLNWVLIYGHLGFPKMEIEGAALATSISRALMALAMFLIIWQDKQLRQLRAEYFSALHSRVSYIKQVLQIGIPSGLQFFWEIAAFYAAQVMAGWLGIVSSSAYQIAINLASITFMVLTGLAAAGNILTGYSYGARDREGIKLAGKAVFVTTLAIELVFVVIFLLGYKVLPRLYTDNAEVLALASSMLIFAAFFQVSDGLQAVAAGALRGMQDVRIPSVIAFVTFWLLMIPMCYLLAFKAGWGLKGIWAGFVIGLSATAILQLLRFWYISKRVEFKEV